MLRNIDDEENLLKARFICESVENYPKDALHMYAENEPAMKRNEAVLNDLPGQLYTIEANNKIQQNIKIFKYFDNCKYQKQTNTGGLAKLLKLKIGAKAMLIINMDIHYRLINGQTGTNRYTEFA